MEPYDPFRRVDMAFNILKVDFKNYTDYLAQINTERQKNKIK